MPSTVAADPIAELIELARKWESRFQWEHLISVNAELRNVREQLRDTEAYHVSRAGPYTPATPDDPDAPYRRLRCIQQAQADDPILTALKQQETHVWNQWLTVSNELGSIRAALETHHPDLLPHWPHNVDLDNPDVTAWTRDVRTLLGALLARRGKPADASVSSAEHFTNIVTLIGDDSLGKKLVIAQDKSKTVEQRQREICALDSRVIAWSGSQWAELLGNCTRQAAEKTDWWKIDRKRLRGGD